MMCNVYNIKILRNAYYNNISVCKMQYYARPAKLFVIDTVK